MLLRKWSKENVEQTPAAASPVRRLLLPPSYRGVSIYHFGLRRGRCRLEVPRDGQKNEKAVEDSPEHRLRKHRGRLIFTTGLPSPYRRGFPDKHMYCNVCTGKNARTHANALAAGWLPVATVTMSALRRGGERRDNTHQNEEE